MIESKKTMRTLSLLTAIILIILLASGCDNNEAVQDCVSSTEDQPESEVTTDMEQSVRLIREAGSLDLDSAQGTMDTLLELGIHSLKEAKLISNNHGVVLQVIDEEDNIYYLGYGGLGYLEIVRKDSLDGEILYAPIE